MLYVDELNIYFFFTILIKNLKCKKIFFKHKKINNLYIKLFNIFFKYSFEKINIEIKDSFNLKTEWIESSLKKNEYQKFKKFIYDNIKSENFKVFGNFEDYFVKSLFNSRDIYEFGNFRSYVYFITMIKLHKKKYNIKDNTVYLQKIHWQEFYKNLGKENDLKIIFYKTYLNNFSLKKILTNIIKLKNLIIKKILIFIYNNIKINNLNNNIKIAFESLGEINFNKNYLNNDFFFNIKNLISNKNIAVEYSSSSEKMNIIKNSMSPYVLFTFENYYNKKIKLKTSKFNYLENKQILNSFKNYNYEKNNWNNFFKKMNIKIYFTWNKYNEKHIAIHDAINNNYGTLAIWERSFEGVPSIEYKTNCDILFKTGSINLISDNISDNKINYKVKVGFLRDYNNNKSNAIITEVKKTLLNSGAKKIISFFDQNSSDQFMHNNQKECYEFLLNYILKNKEIGLVLKPKKPKTLFFRLGDDIKKLFGEAYKTKRIYLFNSSGKWQSNVPVNTAALCSDICIHSNLYAATAGIECALSGVPTLILDRENDYSNLLYDISSKKVIFSSIEELIYNVNEFINNKSESDLGNWSSIINEIDPYRDGKGADRINWYLNSVLNGYLRGYKKSEILLHTANKFSKIWGSDKIIKQ